MFPALSSIMQSAIADTFGRDPAGAQIYAWFPPSLTDSPATRAGYSVALGAVATSPARARRADPLGLAGRPEVTATVVINLEAWFNQYGRALPEKNRTCFLLGTSADDGTTPDASAVRCSVADEARAAGGVLEIDYVRHSTLSA